MTQPTEYSAKSGDTLWGISRKAGVDINSLAKMNNLQGKAVHSLHIGQSSSSLLLRRSMILN